MPRAEPRARRSYVLVVEDETLLRSLIAEELRAAGLTVIEAADADEAWSYISSGGQAEVVFTDVRMPGSMSGLDLARRLKTGFPALDLIVTSGQLAPAEVEGVGAFVPKPYMPEKVVAAVLAVLRSKRGPA